MIRKKYTVPKKEVSRFYGTTPIPEWYDTEVDPDDDETFE